MVELGLLVVGGQELGGFDGVEVVLVEDRGEVGGHALGVYGLDLGEEEVHLFVADRKSVV